MNDIVKRTPSLPEIEALMLHSDNQVEIPTDHLFSGGVYIRRVSIPAGSYVMGKRHRNETCNILLKGTLLVFVEEGKPLVEITGPVIFTSPPGAKKFAYCLEDAEFINVIPTNETDVEKIESQVIISEREYLEVKGETPCLSLQSP